MRALVGEAQCSASALALFSEFGVMPSEIFSANVHVLQVIVEQMADRSEVRKMMLANSLERSRAGTGPSPLQRDIVEKMSTGAQCSDDH